MQEECPDTWTAFCFDETCLYLMKQLEDKKKIYFDEEAEKTKRESKQFMESLFQMSKHANQ